MSGMLYKKLKIGSKNFIFNKNKPILLITGSRIKIKVFRIAIVTICIEILIFKKNVMINIEIQNKFFTGMRASKNPMAIPAATSVGILLELIAFNILTIHFKIIFSSYN